MLDRLDVVMHDVLPVQIGKRGRDLAYEEARLLVGKRQVRQALVKRLPGDALDHDIGLAGEIAGGKPGRHVRPLKARQDHLLHLEGDDRGGILAFAHARNFHEQRHLDVGMCDAP